MPRTSASPAASKSFGATVRAARKERGLTQAALAQRMGVSAVYITNLEGGRVNPTIGQIAAIAAALQMDYRVEFIHVDRREVVLPDAGALSARA